MKTNLIKLHQNKLLLLCILLAFVKSFVFGFINHPISFWHKPETENSATKTESSEEIQARYEICRSVIDERLKKYMVYPQKALRRKISGNVVFRFTVTEEGKLEDLTVLSSDSLVLENAAKELIQKVFPLGVEPLEKFTDCVCISYKIE